MTTEISYKFLRFYTANKVLFIEDFIQMFPLQNKKSLHNGITLLGLRFDTERAVS